MSSKSTCLLATLLLLTSAHCKLEMIIELFRHGARQSQEDLPGLKTIRTFEQFGDLTKTGLRQHFDLGRMLRDKAEYKDLFPENMDYFSIDVKASDKNRTISSVMAHIDGIFYQKKGFEVNTLDIPANWTPPFASDELSQEEQAKLQDPAIPATIQMLPIMSYSPDFNFMFRADGACRDMGKERKASEAYYVKYLKLDTVFAPTYDVLKGLGYDIKKIFTKEAKWGFIKLSRIADILLADRYDKAVPHNPMSLELEAHLMFVNSLYNYISFGSLKNIKAYRTKMFEAWIKIIEDFKTAKDNSGSDDPNLESTTKVYLFSGHDSNVAAVMLALHNPSSADSIVDMYNIFSKESAIDSESSFNDFMTWVRLEEHGARAELSFASNMVIEVYSPDEDQLQDTQANTNNQPENPSILVDSGLIGDVSGWSVKLSYNNQYVKFNENGKQLAMETFIQMLKNNKDSEEEFKKNCGNPLFEIKDVNKPISVVLIILVVINALLIILFLYFFFKVKRTKKKNFVDDNALGQRLMV